jgi:hypothetical protein
MLRDVELYDLYCSRNIRLVIKSRGNAWVGHVTRIVEEEKKVQGFGKPEGKNSLKI